MLLRSHASKALRCLLPAAGSSAGPAAATGPAVAPAGAAAAAAATLPHQRRSASSSSASSGGSQPPSKGGQSDDAPAAVDPDTGLPFSVPPDRQTRDTVEEITIYQLEELLAAKTGIGIDPEVRAAAEAALETLTVCEACNQELDEAGEWESLLSSAGLINSPADYAPVRGGNPDPAGSDDAAKKG